MEPPVSVPTAASDMPVATAMADPPLDPPGERDGSCGFLAGPKPESSRGGAEGELVEVGLADEHRAGFTQAPRHHRIRGGDVLLPDQRPRGGRRALEIDQVLEGEWNAVQRPKAASAGDLLVGLTCPRERQVRGDRDEGVQLAD